MTEEKNEHKYNGWANYETWAVKLWLDNEEPSYRHWTEQAKRWHGEDDAASSLAEQLKEEVREAAPLEESSLYTDLLNAALAEVDWSEIAHSYLDELDEELDEEPDACDGSAMPEPEPQPNPAERPEEESPFGELIFRYTRTQAMADGVLVDVSETAREAGFRIPVALTHAVWAEYVAVPEGVEGQDEAGRLWDVLWMCRFGISREQDEGSETRFQLHVRNDNRPGEPPLVTLKAHIGPGDEGEPVLTIMTPDED